ncbi:hypothetical protein C772_01954 [Bhargavaea cecembensis DSE10]|uniref:Uncharacterized protein n=1 Tax=Bhargavaea cecembensis DSE10 TaxID=1235279 RepID=M7P605_9BACL|nr:hypothetical protein C772_01954 [Bhargavaea cecembensis DSE10]
MEQGPCIRMAQTVDKTDPEEIFWVRFVIHDPFCSLLTRL